MKLFDPIRAYFRKKRELVDKLEREELARRHKATLVAKVKAESGHRLLMERVRQGSEVRKARLRREKKARGRRRPGWKSSLDDMGTIADESYFRPFWMENPERGTSYRRVCPVCMMDYETSFCRAGSTMISAAPPHDCPRMSRDMGITLPDYQGIYLSSVMEGLAIKGFIFHEPPKGVS